MVMMGWRERVCNLPVSPEFYNLAVRDHHATKRDESGDDERIDKRRKDCVGSIRSDHLTDAGIQTFVHDLKHISFAKTMTVAHGRLTTTKKTLPACPAPVGSPAVKYQQT